MNNQELTEYAEKMHEMLFEQNRIIEKIIADMNNHNLKNAANISALVKIINLSDDEKLDFYNLSNAIFQDFLKEVDSRNQKL